MTAMDGKNRRPTQTVRVLDYMRKHGSITTLDAVRDLGVLRLASRIIELKKAGYAISRDRVKVKNRYNEDCSVLRYSLAEEGQPYAHHP